MRKILANLKMGKKMLVVMGTIVITFSMGLAAAIYFISSVSSEMEYFYNTPYRNMTSQMKVDLTVQTVSKYILWACATEDLQTTIGYVNYAEENETLLESEIEFLNKNFDNPELIAELNTNYAALKAASAKTTSLARQNLNVEATDMYNKTYAPAANELQATLVHISEAAEQNATNAYETAQNAERTALITMLIVASGSILLAVAFSIIMSKAIKEPVQEIKYAAERIAVGDLDVVIKYKGKDELGELAVTMASFVGTLKAIIGDVNYLLGEMAGGNFRINSKATDKYVGQYNNILLALRGINENLSSTLSQINQASDQVSSGSDQVSSGAQALSQGATEQASAVEELSATINEVSMKIQETAQNAKNGKDLAISTGKELEEGSVQMEQMVVAMGDISDKSNEIGKIIKTIDDIAFQTNILALNAAVEAARAGSAGKGFAVVADEVRNLAQKSAEAAKNTTALIEGSINAVQKGTSIAAQTAKTITNTVENARNLTSVVQAISVASEEESDAIKQITTGIDQISSVVQTNSATAEESAAASEELSGQSQMLKGLVGKFVLKEDVGNTYTPTSHTSVYSPIVEPVVEHVSEPMPKHTATPKNMATPKHTKEETNSKY